MPFATEQKFIGFAKEASRGVGEASPSKFLPVSNDSELNYSTVLIPDEKVRGLKERFPMQPGVKEGSGTLNVDVEASTVGDLLLGGLGSVATTQPGGATSAYEHRFTRLNSLEMPSFTFFVDRRLSAKRYPLTVFQKLAFSGAVDGKAALSTDLLFKTEEATTALAPNFVAPKPLMFFQTEFKIDGAKDIDVKNWALNIDNGSQGLRTLTCDRDVRNIVSPGMFIIDGGFEIYFESETQRDKFLNVDSAAINIVLTGDEIEPGFNNKLEFSLPQVKYDAYPFGDLDDLLGAAVTFQAEYNDALGASMEAILTNEVVSY